MNCILMHATEGRIHGGTPRLLAFLELAPDSEPNYFLVLTSFLYHATILLDGMLAS